MVVVDLPQPAFSQLEKLPDQIQPKRLVFSNCDIFSVTHKQSSLLQQLRISLLTNSIFFVPNFSTYN